MLNHLCPCCGRHCCLTDPQCERGKLYAQTGVIPPRTHDSDRKPEKAKGAAHKNRYRSLDQDNKLIWNLRDLGHTLRFLSGGKGSQERILIILGEEEEMTQRDLTERIVIQPGSASEVIGKLESAGLLTRTPSEKDRRTSVVRLTEAGRSKAEEAAQQRKQRHTEMFSCLSEEDKADLLTLLEKLNHDWGQRYGEKSSRENYCHDGGRRRPHHKEE